MEFNVNAPILFVLVGIIVAFVLAQSAFFLWRAVKRAKEIGLPQETVRKTISAAAIFTVAPAIAILVGVISLSKSLGIALPWLRLSVVGSLTYETVAAGTSLTELGLDTNTPIPTASDYVTVAAVMTVGIMGEGAPKGRMRGKLSAITREWVAAVTLPLISRLRRQLPPRGKPYMEGAPYASNHSARNPRKRYGQRR